MKYVALVAVLFVPHMIHAGTTKEMVKDAIESAAEETGVPVKILSALCYVESHHNPKALNKYDGNSSSYGLCQIKLATARSVGFKGKVSQLYNPDINARYAARYLKWQYKRYSKNWIKAISAYNGGRALEGNTDYVNKVFTQTMR